MRLNRGSRWSGALAWAGASSLSFCSLSFAQTQTDWADIEGRIQYAYYTNDARALESVLTSLKPKSAEGEDPEAAADAGSRHYFSALAHYRVAQVLAATDKARSRRAIGACGDETDAAVKSLPKVPVGLDDSPEARRLRAENYALATACTLAGREMSSLPLLGGRIGSRIDEAVKFEPKNPRVRLVEALAAHERAGKDAAAKAEAVARLRAVTQMFEAARAGPSTTPEWGAADAYAFLGRVLLEQRDIVGAREALERALLIAPDYAMARQLMSQITR